MSVFIIAAGDTLPDLEMQLKVNGVAYDLSGGKQVKLYLESRATGDLVVDGEDAVIDNAATGMVRFRWTPGAGQTVASGGYRGQWAVIDPNDGSRRFMFPNDKPFDLTITGSLKPVS